MESTKPPRAITCELQQVDSELVELAGFTQEHRRLLGELTHYLSSVDSQDVQRFRKNLTNIL